MARASLHSDAERLRQGWERWGYKVTPVATVFAFEGEPMDLRLPERTLGALRCRTLVAISERYVRLTLARVDAASDGVAVEESSPAGRSPERLGPEGASADNTGASQAGIAVLRDCGELARLRQVRLSVASPRAAVELLLVDHGGDLPPAGLIIPERAVAFVPGADWAAQPLLPEPVVARAARAEQTARIEGAQTVARVQAQAGPKGSGVLTLRLAVGCHRLGLLGAAPPDSSMPVDLDAEARTPEPTTGAKEERSEVLARDRSTAPDARLDLCLAEPGPVELRFGGAPSNSTVTVLDALWPLGSGLDPRWEPAVRARLGWALWRRHAPGLLNPALLQVLGVQGSTVVPVSIEPDGCYVAAMALRAGVASTLRLAVAVDDLVRHDQVSEPPYGAVVSFCASGSDHALIQAEARAGFAWWQLALWRVGRVGRVPTTTGASGP